VTGHGADALPSDAGSEKRRATRVARRIRVAAALRLGARGRPPAQLLLAPSLQGVDRLNPLTWVKAISGKG